MRLRADHARRTDRRHNYRRVAKDVVNIVLQFRAPHFQFFDFLVRCEINLLLDAIDFVIQPVDSL